MVAQLPLNHETNSAQFARPDQLPSDPQEWPVAISARVSPDYFDALRIPLLVGRAFDSSDESANSLSVVISQVLADRLWPEQSALGQTLLANDARDPDTYTVVGVVGDIHHDGLTGPLVAQLYLPMVQSARRRRHLTLSVVGSPASAVATVRETLLRIDPNLPLKIRPMGSVVAESAIIWSVSSVMLGVFGLVALLLATLGIYGVISYSVQQRRKEIGLRMALGASARQVRVRVLGDGLRLTGLGLLVGLGLALGLGKLLAAVLFGVSSYDPITLSSVFTLFVAVAVFASLAPAVKASRVAPHVALRQD
jgi:predicted permease